MVKRRIKCGRRKIELWVRKKKWDDAQEKECLARVIIITGRMIKRHIFTCNGLKCSASQDQSRKRR
jgi:hypothetical protein